MCHSCTNKSPSDPHILVLGNRAEEPWGHFAEQPRFLLSCSHLATTYVDKTTVLDLHVQISSWFFNTDIYSSTAEHMRHPRYPTPSCQPMLLCTPPENHLYPSTQLGLQDGTHYSYHGSSPHPGPSAQASIPTCRDPHPDLARGPVLRHVLCQLHLQELSVGEARYIQQTHRAWCRLRPRLC